MDYLRKTLEAVFRFQEVDDIIHGLLSSDNNDNLETGISETALQILMMKVGVNDTLDQLSIINYLLNEKWVEGDDEIKSLNFSKRPTMFNALLHFSCQTLHIHDGDPICKYEDLLRWHSLTQHLGEDLFVTSFLASHNLKSQESRTAFDWEPYLNHDSNELNSLFQKPFSDLHNHLYGSSVNFELNWMALMNHISNRENVFRELSKYPTYKQDGNTVERYSQTIIAAEIRFYLYKKYVCKDASSYIDVMNDIDVYSKKQYRKQIINHVQELQDKIDSISNEFSIDYADNNQSTLFYKELAGERRFMYEIFSRIFETEDNNQTEESEDWNLFYLYIVLKSKLRDNIIQNNNVVGFANFDSYEKHKMIFIDGYPAYKNILVKYAIVGMLNSDPENRYIESRITPKESVIELDQKIKEYSNILGKFHYCSADEKNNKYSAIKEDKDLIYINYGYIIHFIKLRDNDETTPKNVVQTPRHKIQRDKIRRQAEAIVGLRKEKAYRESRGLIVGVDAANSEILCRPEVFAHTFRYLREHSFPNDSDRPDDLGMTYHVGEDFYDIVDGLRAIDEVVTFLNFRNSDRLGHALVLGTDVQTYYEKRTFTVSMPKQVLLDNVAWLYMRIMRTEGFNPICTYLEDLFAKYYMNIFKEDRTIDIPVYYNSWLLRGDDPMMYQCDGKISEDNYENKWDQASLNYCDHVVVARKDKAARILYYKYHYEVIKRGNEGENLKIDFKMQSQLLAAIEKVQSQMLDEVENCHLVIECNPSSNFLIGEFDQYIEHPILKFFNYGLNTPYPQHHISVSINTDDKGVFATSLEREYSLLALALEKNNRKGLHNSPRAILDWLNKIREMTQEQRFSKYESRRKKK